MISGEYKWIDYILNWIVYFEERNLAWMRTEYIALDSPVGGN